MSTKRNAPLTVAEKRAIKSILTKHNPVNRRRKTRKGAAHILNTNSARKSLGRHTIGLSIFPDARKPVIFVALRESTGSFIRMYEHKYSSEAGAKRAYANIKSMAAIGRFVALKGTKVARTTRGKVPKKIRLAKKNPSNSYKVVSKVKIPKGKTKGDMFISRGVKYAVVSFVSAAGKRVRYARRA